MPAQLAESLLGVSPLGTVVALACMILAGGAAAKASNFNFALTQVGSGVCAGPALFNVRMSFTPPPDAKEYTVNSGNACQLGAVPCGISGTACKVPCAGPGPCAFDLTKCQQGKGLPWVKVSVPYRYNYNQAPIQAPGPCR